MSGLDIGYLENLSRAGDASVRTELARQLAAFVADPDAASTDVEGLTPILVALADDTVISVRAALATALGAAASTPEAVLRAQLDDIDEIAVFYLRRSPLLDDDDLHELVCTGTPARQMAIARRCAVSAEISQALVGRGERPVIAALLDNPNADIADAAYIACARDHGRSPAIREALLRRSDLPLSLKAHLISLLSVKLGRAAEELNWLDHARAKQVTVRARERTMIRLARQSSQEEIADLIARLDATGQLSDAMILRAACLGNLTFVVEALSVRARMPAQRVRGLMGPRPGIGLAGVAMRAGLDEAAANIIAVALEVHQGLAHEGADEDEDRFGHRMIERILTRIDKIKGREKTGLLEILADHGAATPAKLARKVIAQLADAA